MAVKEVIEEVNNNLNDLFIIYDYTITKEVTSTTRTSSYKALTVHDGYSLAGAFFISKNSIWSDDTIYVNASSASLNVVISPYATFTYSATVRVLWLKQF